MILDAALIRRRRAERGLSAREVAKHLGVSGPVVSAIEAGTNHNDVSLAHWLRLAAALEVEPVTLLAPSHPGHQPPTAAPAAAEDDAAVRRLAPRGNERPDASRRPL